MVRPWALSAPVFVLLICLPLLRPLRHPDPRLVSDDEQARLGTVQALVEQHTFAIERTGFRATRCLVVGHDGHWYSDQSPVMSVLLSGPYWVMHRWGLDFDRNPVITEYLLTLFGVTLPVAFAAGLLYRLGRLFELPRPYRAGFALAVVVSSGWISYATVLSAGAAAAALLVMSVTCLFEATLSRSRPAVFAWIAAAGLCGAFAATYELPAAAVLLLLVVVISVMRLPLSARIVGMAVYLAGAMIPLVLYAGLNRPITGDLKPGYLHPELRPIVVELPPDASNRTELRWTEEDEELPTRWHAFTHGFGRFVQAFLGDHGVLTHFPVLIFGVLGFSLVMRRHWPTSTKVLAAACLVGAILVITACVADRLEWKDAMFANRWFVVVLPLTLFWAGAWLRRSHRPATWAVAGVLLCFSTTIALLGATDPQPRQGYDRSTAAAAWTHLFHPPTPPRVAEMIADR